MTCGRQTVGMMDIDQKVIELRPKAQSGNKPLSEGKPVDTPWRYIRVEERAKYRLMRFNELTMQCG